jgi:ankyrin repeat protein
MQAGSDAYDLLHAARNNDWELVEGLAESGTFPDTSLQDGKTALMYACMQGQTQVVKRLVEKGASVSTADNVRLSITCGRIYEKELYS